MIRPLELFVGLRYTRAKRRNHFISFISLTSMFGITIGVWALISVLSVMNGFQKELRTRILGVAAHATVSGPDGWLGDWKTATIRIARNPEVEGQAPYIVGQGMLARGRAGHPPQGRGYGIRHRSKNDRGQAQRAETGRVRYRIRQRPGLETERPGGIQSHPDLPGRPGDPGGTDASAQAIYGGGTIPGRDVRVRQRIRTDQSG